MWLYRNGETLNNFNVDAFTLAVPCNFLLFSNFILGANLKW